MNRQFLEEILPLVQTPSHYLGTEINATRKSLESARFKIVLAFPDLYEIGMSHLGIQILYHIINSREDAVAERVFAPRADLEAELRATETPLCSLESRAPLARFDVIGFSLLYELNFTNILNMLSLSEVPLYARDRDDSDPVVLAGGPCTFNPEPLADFFDAMVIGDGERVINDLIEQWLVWKEAGENREGLLRRWAQLSGIYIPSFFETSQDGNGNQILLPNMDGYETIEKAIVPDLNRLPYPECPVIPFGKPIHDRLSLEICRGCTRGCRFCQAGMIYRPVRERSPAKILTWADRALRSTGYDDVSLLSLSTGDYGGLQSLMVRLMGRCEPDKIAVSLPSLRVGSLTESLMTQIKRVRKTGFTLAPEAGSPRLRDVINKNITEEDLLENIEKAFALGWRLVKLYFMVGLPTETDGDVDAILDLVGRLRKPAVSGGQRRDINVSVSTFVPKAHTPFQWAHQIPLEESKRKIRYLRSRLKGKGLRFKWQNPEMSILEGLWARGDRRLAKLLVKAFEMGCRFDGWSDQFQFSTWMEAMEATDIQIETYNRSRQLDEPLPWDHIESGVSKAFLSEEWERAVEGTPVADCRQGDCHACGVCDFETVQPVTFDEEEVAFSPKGSSGEHSEDRLFRKLRVSYAKTGPGRFFGHLEMVRIITRAFNRAKIPLRFTQGFHPSPKISFSSPLPVGTESKEEHFVVEVPPHVSPESLIKQVNAQLPGGLEFSDCTALGSSKTQSEAVFDYTIRLNDGAFSKDRIDGFQKAPSWPIERKNKKGRIRTIDLKKVVIQLRLEKPNTLRMRVDLSAGLHVRPSVVLENVFSLSPREIKLVSIMKEPVR